VIWIAWRYQRSVVLALVLVALLVIGFALTTGVMQYHDLVQFFGAPCHGTQIATPGKGDLCGIAAVKLANISGYDSYVRVAGFVAAPLVGAMLGLLAVVNELDHRTARLAWTQSISRNRWFVAKAGVGAAIVVLILVPIAVVLSWWNGEVRGADVFSSETFGIAGWDLVAYGLFAFALAILLGAVIRRVGWTLAAVAVLFLAVAFGFPSHVRQHLVTPTVHWSQLTAANSNSRTSDYFPQNSWLLVNGVVPRSTTGVPTWNEVVATLPRVESCEGNYPQETESTYVKSEIRCYRKLDVEQVSVYVAGDQFWTLQLREGLLYLVAVVLLSGSSLLIIRRIEP
jgi:ABC-type transport system involved in multi-copper enzyme maturation permease subunit